MTCFSDCPFSLSLPPSSLSLHLCSPRELWSASMTRMTAHSPSLWTRRLSISKVSPAFSVLVFIPFSSLCCRQQPYLDTLVCLHRLSPSLVPPPLRDLDWSTQTAGNDMRGHNVTDVSDHSFFSVDPLQLWSELLLISGDEHESGIHLFNCNPESKLSSFFCLLLGFWWLWLSRKIASCAPLQSSLESPTLLLLNIS